MAANIKPYLTQKLCKLAVAGSFGVNMFSQHWGPVGCDYRAELHRDTWAGPQVGGYVVGEVQEEAQQQAYREAADP